MPSNDIQLRPTQRLTNPPLLEAIVEIRWALKPTLQVPNINSQLSSLGTDPNYKILVSRFYDKVLPKYKAYEPLPTLNLPDEMVNYEAQHRFRIDKGGWPLVQIGPGVATLNDTTKYEWSDFETRAQQLVSWLFEAYPSSEQALKINSLSLRYIDAVPFNYEADNVFDFISTNLHTKIDFPKAIFDEVRISPQPIATHNIFRFKSTKPRGVLQLQFTRAKKDEQDILTWEIVVQSAEQDVPKMPTGFATWLREAHAVTHNLFFAMIEGPLLERLK